MALIPTYRIFKADGTWMYDTTSLRIVNEHVHKGYTCSKLPTGMWLKA
jgi:hypothetical protein